MRLAPLLSNIKHYGLRIVWCHIRKQFRVIYKWGWVLHSLIWILPCNYMYVGLLSSSVGVLSESNLSFYLRMNGMILAIISIFSRGPLKSSLSN